MKNVVLSIQEKLQNEIIELQYIDEDWGQLDYYSANMPVKWPCLLIDVTDAEYSETGKDWNQVPNRQIATVSVTLTFANLKLTNTSYRAPLLQKEKAHHIWDIILKVHEILRGWSPVQDAGQMKRESHRRVIRDDGVQEYKVIYSTTVQNV